MPDVATCGLPGAIPEDPRARHLQVSRQLLTVGERDRRLPSFDAADAFTDRQLADYEALNQALFESAFDNNNFSSGA